jgi:microcystin-dependent protein/predicted transcriptional regulator
VKYTGLDVPVLGIQTGDSLSYVEQALIGFLVSTLDGTGIKLTIDPSIICEIVSKNLVACEELSLPNVINALIKAICELDERVTTLEGDFAALEGPYTVGCLTGVTSTSGTHAILQAAIDKICGLEIELDALALNVSTNYVKYSELNALIAAYLASMSTTSTKYYTKMVPFTVVEYYGAVTGNFDVSGAGVGLFEKVYLCNGNNGTPDKRGRVPVGTTTGMGGGPLNPAVDPTVAGNPSYTLFGAQGANSIVLTTAQIPVHTHTGSAVSTVTDPGHKHSLIPDTYAGNDGRGTGISTSGADAFNWETGKVRVDVVDTATTGVTVGTTITVNSAGGGLAHPNFQPGLGCYYIMYIP